VNSEKTAEKPTLEETQHPESGTLDEKKESGEDGELD
jgi:hypothetical protein